jgi:hypothetical protein
MYTFIRNAATWTILGALGAVAVLVVVTLIRRRRRGTPDYPSILADYDGARPPAGTESDAWVTRPVPGELNDGDKAWLTSIVRARYFAKLPRRGDLLLGLIVACDMVSLLVLGTLYRLTDVSIEVPSLIATVVSYGVAALPLALIGLLRWGWKSNAARRHIGIAWDVATFWPRAYHPFAPPCYAERAVPDLQWRLYYLQAHGAKVTIAAHSQGTVVAAAALLQQDARMPGSDLRLITFGSPLDTLYNWAFPAYFDDSALHRIVDPANPARVSRWHNFFYRTDYIGNTTIAGAGNTLLPDPPTPYYIVGQPRPHVGSHSGYWTDPAVWAEVEEPPAPPSPPSLAPDQPSKPEPTGAPNI